MIPQYIIDKLSDFRKREVEGNQAGMLISMVR
jgi:hypothetical protein